MMFMNNGLLLLIVTKITSKYDESGKPGPKVV